MKPKLSLLQKRGSGTVMQLARVTYAGIKQTQKHNTTVVSIDITFRLIVRLRVVLDAV